jgi:hypothetical protein
VAKPTVPSEASISTQKEPSTLMPQLVREPRYFSHCELGVEMGVSMSLDVSEAMEGGQDLPVAALDVVVVAAAADAVHDKGADGGDVGKGASLGGHGSERAEVSRRRREVMMEDVRQREGRL